MFTDTTDAAITPTLVPDNRRLRFLPRHFGALLMVVEQAVYDHARRLCADYQGGYWEYIELSNEGGYMRLAPADQQLTVSSPNSHSVRMSGDAFGITVMLFALSHLSFDYENHRDGEKLAEGFHRLRDYVQGHPEARAIFQAID